MLSYARINIFINQLPLTADVVTQSVRTSATAPDIAWLTYTKQYSTYFSEKYSQSKFNECCPRITFFSTMYSRNVGDCSDENNMRCLPYNRTRSALSKIHAGYSKRTPIPACGSHGKMLRACTLNTNCSLQSTYKIHFKTLVTNVHEHECDIYKDVIQFFSSFPTYLNKSGGRNLCRYRSNRP